MNNISITSIDLLLPQSQCQQCTYVSCYAYAEAIVDQQEAINKCAFGGEPIMLALANQLNIPPQYPVQAAKSAQVAFIDEANCIGCTKCINACPTDAIIGGKRVLHTVISQFCTGCNLCVEPCPTDCIQLVPSNGQPLAAEIAKARFTAKKSRNKPIKNALAPPIINPAVPYSIKPNSPLAKESDDSRKLAVAEAIARAKAKRAQQQTVINVNLYKK